MSKATENERAEAIETLRGWLQPGDTVYTIVESVSRSGMSRTLRVLLIQTKDGAGNPMKDGRPAILHPNWSFAKLLGCRLSSKAGKDGFRVNGCGMDMGFHVVYSASRMLFPDGFGCIGEGCPSNDHSNGDRDYTPHATYLHDKAQREKLGKPPTREPHWHNDGGYALRHAWL